jgi:hypothetical protein
VRIHGEGEVEDDLRAFGMNKDIGGIARQFVLGVVQTADGLPLMHTVHPGNVAETKTLQGMLTTVLERFPNPRGGRDLAETGDRAQEFVLVRTRLILAMCRSTRASRAPGQDKAFPPLIESIGDSASR